VARDAGVDTVLETGIVDAGDDDTPDAREIDSSADPSFDLDGGDDAALDGANAAEHGDGAAFDADAFALDANNATDAGHDSSDAAAVGDAASDATETVPMDASGEASSPIDAATQGSDAADAGEAGHAGVQCLGNVSIDFAALAPYWVDMSRACGAATFASGALQLTRNGACTSEQPGGWIGLDPTRWQLCGDFDVQVDFELVSFTIPSSGGGTRWAVVRAFDPASSAGIALERYAAPPANPCPPSTQSYKSWSTTSVDCGGATMIPTTDATGAMRLTRAGGTVKSYYRTAANGGTWTSFVTASGMTTTPWTLVFYTGYDASGGDRTSQSVSFRALQVSSASTP
jgi:hypothetical protein